MKKTISISVIVLLALGFGYYLFSISPQEQAAQPQAEEFDLSGVQQISQPSEAAPEDYVLGNRDAKNTLVIFEDFQCPACANFTPIIKRVPEVFVDTKVVFRHYPLLSIHKNAAVASFAAEAAGAQGKFWEMADQLYARQAEWSSLANPEGKLAELAQDAGVPDIERFKSDTAEKRYKDKVQRDLVEALGLGAPGTPTVYFNGQQLRLGDINSLKQQAESLYRQ